MTDILVNLKRFDVPRRMGGLCPQNDPGAWVEWIIEQTIVLKINTLGVNIVYFLPEALLLPGVKKLAGYSLSEKVNLAIGSQGVFREDVGMGGNFGAFTTNLPAGAVKNMGCTWTIIGHSEERKDKFEILAAYDKEITADIMQMEKANNTIHLLLNKEAKAAYKQGLDVCFCVGETAEERGGGSFEDQRQGIEKILEAQLLIGLDGVKPYPDKNRLVIGYEPRWAIGPGKTPPNGEYIGFVSDFIKRTCNRLFEFIPNVIYGGGLKRENAEMIAGVPTIDGGLVALTKFTSPISFDPEAFKEIIQDYLKV